MCKNLKSPSSPIRTANPSSTLKNNKNSRCRMFILEARGEAKSNEGRGLDHAPESGCMPVVVLMSFSRCQYNIKDWKEERGKNKNRKKKHYNLVRGRTRLFKFFRTPFSSRSLSCSITHSSLSSKVTTLVSRCQKASTTWVKKAGLRQEYIMIERESRAFTCHKVIKQRTTCFLFLFL